MRGAIDESRLMRGRQNIIGFRHHSIIGVPQVLSNEISHAKQALLMGDTVFSFPLTKPKGPRVKVLVYKY